MKKTKNLKTGVLIATATAVLLSTGCQEKTKPKEANQFDNPPACVVTVIPYAEKSAYDNAYHNNVARGGGGGEQPGIFFGHVFTPYPFVGSTGYGGASPGMVGRASAPYAPGTLRTSSGVRAYAKGTPGARAVSRGGFGGRAGNFSVGA